jgi:hypothetical protein
MRDDELDRLLAAEFPGIEPSSGFAASVMEAVGEQASAPSPIPFPWRRALPGLAGAAVAVAWGVVEFLRLSLAPPAAPPLSVPLPFGVVTIAGVVASILAGTLVAAAAAALSMKFVSTRAA